MEKGEPEKTAADKAKRARKDAEESHAATLRAMADKKGKKDDDDDDDAKKKRADAAVAAVMPGLDARLADIVRQIPKQLTDEERHEFGTRQARADEVYSALGKRAPHPLTGEDVLAYRKRLVQLLKTHSPNWKDVDVQTLKADAFEVAEGQILRDALQAAMHPLDLAEDELRQITRVDSATGVRTTEFVGKRSFVAGLKRPPAYVTRFFTGERKEA